MTAPIETLKDCAQEAEFQLLCAKDYLTWLASLARAIQLAHAHGESEVGAGLASIAKYLGDSGLGAASAAINEFTQIADPDAAPQNTGLANRDAEVEGGQ